MEGEDPPPTYSQDANQQQQQQEGDDDPPPAYSVDEDLPAYPFLSDTRSLSTTSSDSLVLSILDEVSSFPKLVYDGCMVI